MPPPDDSDVPRAAPIVRFPAAVRAAGIIWIGLGVFSLVSAILSLFLNIVPAAANPGQLIQGNPCLSACGLLLAIAFLSMGGQTVRGTSRGVVENGICSVLLGLLNVAGAIFLLAGAEHFVFIVVAALSGGLGVALLTAGILAVAGRNAYAEWRAAHALPIHTRRRTAEEEDYDDQLMQPRDESSEER
jgi:hypothetical protein